MTKLLFLSFAFFNFSIQLSFADYKVKSPGLKKCIDGNKNICFALVTNSRITEGDAKTFYKFAQDKCKKEGTDSDMCSLEASLAYNRFKMPNSIKLLEKFCKTKTNIVSSRCSDLIEYYLGKGKIKSQKNLEKAKEIADLCFKRKKGFGATCLYSISPLMAGEGDFNYAIKLLKKAYKDPELRKDKSYLKLYKKEDQAESLLKKITSAKLSLPEYRSNSENYCKSEWTKLGKLDQKMYDYCLGKAQKAYKELKYEFNQFKDHSWYKIAMHDALEKWRKKKIFDASQVNYIYDRNKKAYFEILRHKKSNQRYDSMLLELCFRNYASDMNVNLIGNCIDEVYKDPKDFRRLVQRNIVSRSIFEPILSKSSTSFAILSDIKLNLMKFGYFKEEIINNDCPAGYKVKKAGSKVPDLFEQFECKRTNGVPSVITWNHYAGNKIPTFVGLDIPVSKIDGGCSRKGIESFAGDTKELVNEKGTNVSLRINKGKIFISCNKQFDHVSVFYDYRHDLPSFKSKLSLAQKENGNYFDQYLALIQVTSFWSSQVANWKNPEMKKAIRYAVEHIYDTHIAPNLEQIKKNAKTDFELALYNSVKDKQDIINKSVDSVLSAISESKTRKKSINKAPDGQTLVKMLYLSN